MAIMTPAVTKSQPASRADLFFSFTLLALQGFGGVLGVVQRELVERRQWLSNEEFVEEWAVAQIMPGPNVVNLSLMIGSRFFGLSGALAALAGMLTFPLLLLLGLALLYAQVAAIPAVVGALRGMSAVTAGMIIATGLRLLSALKTHPLGWRMCAGFSLTCFVAVAWLHFPLIIVLLGLGGISSLLVYRKLSA